MLRAASAENLPVVTWSVVSGDVGGHVPPARMVQTVLDETRPGAIIIFHINRREPYTKKALPDIIADAGRQPWVRAMGIRAAAPAVTALLAATLTADLV